MVSLLAAEAELLVLLLTLEVGTAGRVLPVLAGFFKGDVKEILVVGWAGSSFVTAL